MALFWKYKTLYYWAQESAKMKDTEEEKEDEHDEDKDKMK
jgi:hypothetical protein